MIIRACDRCGAQSKEGNKPILFVRANINALPNVTRQEVVIQEQVGGQPMTNSPDQRSECLLCVPCYDELVRKFRVLLRQYTDGARVGMVDPAVTSIIVHGNVIDGLQFAGPFETDEIAGDYADSVQVFRATDWHVANLFAPDPLVLEAMK